jgi:hypothetical protein
MMRRMDQAPFSAFRTAVPGASGSFRHRAFDPQMNPVYIGLALAGMSLLIGLPLAGLSIDIVLACAFLLVCGLFIWTAACLRLRGLQRIATGIEAWTLLNMASLAGVLGSYAVGRIPMPLADHWMIAADRVLAPGLDWRAMMLALTRHPWLIDGANHVYGSLEWQGTVLILLCSVTGHSERCAAFVLRWIITLAMIVGVFALLPCYGPDFYHGLKHAEVPAIRSDAGWCAPPIMKWLHSTGRLRLDLSAVTGIVTFPSFHAASAILFAWGFWTVRWARWPMLALNLAMIAATPPIGGHYFIDVLAGIAIAGIGIALPAWCAELKRLIAQTDKSAGLSPLAQ